MVQNNSDIFFVFNIFQYISRIQKEICLKNIWVMVGGS